MKEIEEQHSVLLQAFANSEINFLPGTYEYQEFNSHELNSNLNPTALALVRDGDRWSQLVKKQESDRGAFVLFSIHFNGKDDVNGFVGWFASYLKEKLGIGLIVFVGMNSLKNGVYDYYGVPENREDDVKDELSLLVKSI